MDAPVRTNWLALEDEVREVLRKNGDGEIADSAALRCIDEALARYTGRGNSMPQNLDDITIKRIALAHPKYFDWERRGQAKAKTPCPVALPIGTGPSARCSRCGFPSEQHKRTK